MCIRDSYDPAINGGNGIQVNNDHLHLRTTGDNPALGWCKALDYGRVDGSLYPVSYPHLRAIRHARLLQSPFDFF